MLFQHFSLYQRWSITCDTFLKAETFFVTSFFLLTFLSISRQFNQIFFIFCVCAKKKHSGFTFHPVLAFSRLSLYSIWEGFTLLPEGVKDLYSIKLEVLLSCPTNWCLQSVVECLSHFIFLSDFLHEIEYYFSFNSRFIPSRLFSNEIMMSSRRNEPHFWDIHPSVFEVSL